MPRLHHFASPSALAAALRFEADVRGYRWRMERGLARAGRTGGRVVVGPWLSEIGFEILYWIPLLRRLLAHGGVRPAQVTAISRGGVGPGAGRRAGRGRRRASARPAGAGRRGSLRRR